VDRRREGLKQPKTESDPCTMIFHNFFLKAQTKALTFRPDRALS
jgi:hypothetical protein